MGDIQFKEMSIDEIKSENGRTVIKSGGQFYSFFQTKKDGQPSRAQSDFEKLQPTIGQTYSFGITENVKQMPDGKTVTFRNIVLISEARGNGNNNQASNQQPSQTPPANNQPPVPNNIPDPTPPEDMPEF